MNSSSVNQRILLLLLLCISALFFVMIRYFLMVIVLAAIFSALAMPIFNRFERWLWGNKTVSAVITMLLIVLVVIFPLALLFVVVIGQAITLSRIVVPWIQHHEFSSSLFDKHLQTLPFYNELVLYREEIIQKLGEIAATVGSSLFNTLSTVTYSAATDVFLFFVFLYTMFFFLRDGKQLLPTIVALLPLSHDDQYRLLDKFLSVTRAMLKGSLVVGMVQGSLAGLALHVAGIESALLWGTMMSFLAVIPILGSAIIWLPAVIYLAALGHYPQAIGVLLFCTLVVGQIDNILRPILVGRDTQMHELLIFFGTLGGISLFGIFGILLGPIIAALFVTVWEMYAETFKEHLAIMKDQHTNTLL